MGYLVDADLERPDKHPQAVRDVHVVAPCQTCGENTLFSKMFNGPSATGDLVEQATEAACYALKMSRQSAFSAWPEPDIDGLAEELREMEKAYAFLDYTGLHYVESIECNGTLHDFSTDSLVTAAKEIIEMARWAYRQGVLPEKEVDKLFPVVTAQDAIPVLEMVNAMTDYSINLTLTAGVRKKQELILVGS